MSFFVNMSVLQFTIYCQHITFNTAKTIDIINLKNVGTSYFGHISSHRRC